MGLSNVERRLACYYGVEASFTLTRGTSGVTIAELILPVTGIDFDAAPLCCVRDGV